MQDYKVIFKRSFICETVVKAETAHAAHKQVEDDWAVPMDCGTNMDEELWTMRRALGDGTLTPIAVQTQPLYVV